MKFKSIAVAAVSIMCCLLTSCGKTEINVNNYLTTEVNGYDGNGYAGWNVDLGQLVKDNYQAFGLKDGYSVIEYQNVVNKLKDNMNASYDKSEDLSNGDSVKLTWDTTKFDTIESDFKIKLLTKDVDITVSDLQEVEELNVFDHIKLQYTGTAPNATAIVDNKALMDMNLPQTVRFEVTPSENLNNGDTVTVKLTQGTDEAFLNSGYRLTETEHKFTVEGLDAYLMSLDDLPADASEKMESHGQDVLKAEIASYWDNPADLSEISLLGNYLLTAKEGLQPNPSNALIYVYEIKSKDHSYYSYVEYRNIMILGDGTCSFKLQDTAKPVGSVSFGAWGTVFEHNGLTYIGYADLDTMFNEVVTQRIATYDYKSTVS